MKCFFFAYHFIVDTINAKIKAILIEEWEKLYEKEWLHSIALILISFFYLVFEGGQNHFVFAQ